MKKIPLLTLTFLICHSLYSQPEEAGYSNLLENYIKEIETTLNKSSVKAISFALIDGNRIVYSGNYGYSDFENRIKADSNTVYGIGSISKLFTAASALQLHEKGVIDIDSPLTKYCPNFKIKTRFETDLEITPRMLICHYSGLPSDITNGTFSKKPEHFSSVNVLLEKEYAPYPPNYVYSYSNIGYCLLGVLIENSTGRNYEEYIKRYIFEPLEMHSATVDGDNSVLMLKGYDENGNLRDEYGIRPAPAGAIKSNIKDLAKFAMTFLPAYNGTKILGLNTINSMFTEQNQTIQLDLGEKHGMPWFFENKNSAGQIYYHSGGTMNHRGLMVIAPESNLALVILSNSVNIGRFHRLSIDLLDSCAKLKGRTPYLKSKMDFPVLDTVYISNDDLAKYTGLYAHPSFVFELSAKKNQLYTRIQNADYFLKPLKDGTFVPLILDSNGSLLVQKNVRFEFSNINENDLLIYHNLGNNSKQILGTKFYRQEIDSLWNSRIGKYEILETNSNDHLFLSYFELAIENGVLVFNQMEDYEGLEKWQTALAVKDNNTAFSLGIGRHRGTTLLFESENGNEILWFSGYKLKRFQ
jgi:CubicO group peptidase (beta-lactamase class C family)